MWDATNYYFHAVKEYTSLFYLREAGGTKTS